MKGTQVATVADVEALERRVADLERRVARAGNPDWIPVARSPLGPRKTRKLVHAGKLAASRVGRRLYVLTDEVNAFLAARPVKVVRPVADETAVECGDAAGYAERHLHLLTAGVRMKGAER